MHAHNIFRLVVALSAATFLSMGCANGDESSSSKEIAKGKKGAKESTAGEVPGGKDAPQGTPLMLVKREDKVVTVNGVTLFGSDFQRSFQKQAQAIGLPPGKIPMEIAALLESPTVEQMEKRELLTQEAKAKKLAPNREEVLKEVAKVKSKLGDIKKFDAMLAGLRASEVDFEKGMATNMAIENLVRKSVKDYGLIDEAGARRIYEENPARWASDKRVDLRQILISVPPGASNDVVKKLREDAEGIRIEVLGKSKKEFERVAKEKSDDARTKARGGQMGVLPMRALLPDVGPAAFALKKDEISAPIRSGKGFHILRSDGVTTKKFKFVDVKNNIMSQENRLRQNLAVTELLKRLRDAATIVRHLTPTPLPKPKTPPPPDLSAIGAPGMGGPGTGGPGMGGPGMGGPGMGHGQAPSAANLRPGVNNPHNAATGVPLDQLPPPTKENVLPGMRNPHGGGGKKHAAPMAPTAPKAQPTPKLKLGG